MTLRSFALAAVASAGLVAATAARPTLQAASVPRQVRIDLAVGALEPSIGNDAGPAMAGAGAKNHVEITRFDDAVQVHVKQIEARRRTPMAEQPRLYVFEPDRFFQKGIVEQINLANRQVVCGTPPGVDKPEFLN